MLVPGIIFAVCILMLPKGKYHFYKNLFLVKQAALKKLEVTLKSLSNFPDVTGWLAGDRWDNTEADVISPKLHLLQVLLTRLWLRGWQYTWEASDITTEVWCVERLRDE